MGVDGFLILGNRRQRPNLLVTQNVTLCLQNGCSPVYVGSQYGHSDVVDQLVQAGADIHLATTKVHINIHSVLLSSNSSCETYVRLIECASPLN